MNDRKPHHSLAVGSSPGLARISAAKKLTYGLTEGISTFPVKLGPPRKLPRGYELDIMLGLDRLSNPERFRRRRVDPDAAKARRDGYVYAVAATGGEIKFGWTSDPHNRLLQLDATQPRPIRVLGVFRGSRVDEAALLVRFRRLCLRGEWFQLDSELRDWLAAAGCSMQGVPVPRFRTP